MASALSFVAGHHDTVQTGDEGNPDAAMTYGRAGSIMRAGEKVS